MKSTANSKRHTHASTPVAFPMPPQTPPKIRSVRLRLKALTGSLVQQDLLEIDARLGTAAN